MKKNNPNELERILDLLADAECELYYMRDKAEYEGLDREQTIAVHALVNSALLQWHGMIRKKEEAEE
jgi:hypothetical protein